MTQVTHEGLFTNAIPGHGSGLAGGAHGTVVRQGLQGPGRDLLGEEAVDDLLGVLDAGAPAELLAEGHGAEAEGADAQAGAAQGDVVMERHAGRFPGERGAEC